MLDFMLSKVEIRKNPNELYNFDLEPTPPLLLVSVLNVWTEITDRPGMMYSVFTWEGKFQNIPVS